MRLPCQRCMNTGLGLRARQNIRPCRARGIVAQVYRWSAPQSPGQPRKREHIYNNYDHDQVSESHSTQTQAASTRASQSDHQTAEAGSSAHDAEEPFAPAVPSSSQAENEDASGWDDYEQYSRETGWGEPVLAGDWGEQDPDNSYSGSWDSAEIPRGSSAYPEPSAYDERYGGSQQEGASSSQPWFTEQDGGDADYYPSDITVLTKREQDQILPLLPNGQQANFYSPKTLPERTVQVAASLMGVVVFAKSAALSVPALLYPVWGPWVRAGARNVEMLSKNFKYIGLWRAQVLDIELVLPFQYQTGYQRTSQGQETSVRLVVGDPWKGGARTELYLPFEEGVQDVRPGEPAELLVLSPDYDFQSFKVVREVYLPEAGIWLAEYPFSNRDLFLDISLEIERSRQANKASVFQSVAEAGPQSSAGDMNAAW